MDLILRQNITIVLTNRIRFRELGDKSFKFFYKDEYEKIR